MGDEEVGVSVVKPALQLIPRRTGAGMLLVELVEGEVGLWGKRLEEGAEVSGTEDGWGTDVGGGVGTGFVGFHHRGYFQGR